VAWWVGLVPKVRTSMRAVACFRPLDDRFVRGRGRSGRPLINGAIFPDSDDSMARAASDLKLPLEVKAQLFAPFDAGLTRNRHKNQARIR
jgi:hypothetical protein